MIKSLITLVAFTFVGSMALALETVNISGRSAERLFFALENNDADLVLHTKRFTIYKLENIECTAESIHLSGPAKFSCKIQIGH